MTTNSPVPTQRPRPRDDDMGTVIPAQAAPPPGSPPPRRPSPLMGRPSPAFPAAP